MKQKLILPFFCFLLTVLQGVAAAGEGKVLTVAVAANFIEAMEEVKHTFTKVSGIQLRTVYSSTGKLYAQIQHGAPFDVFLAADARRPDLLLREKKCQDAFLYAKGRLVLWTKNQKTATEKKWQQVIQSEKIKRLAIAKPDIAPYGEAAKVALEEGGLWQKVRPRLVYGQSVGQAFQYGQQGSVDFAFVALSQALSREGKRGQFWQISQAPRILQKGCILNRSRNRADAQRFVRFLLGPDGLKIKEQYGYR